MTPTLQSLTIRTQSRLLDPPGAMVFSTVSLPHLTHLVVMFSQMDANTEVAFAHFLFGHPNITSLKCTTPNPQPLPPGSLPLLSDLWGHSQFIRAFLADRTEPPRMLRCIEGLVLSDEILEYLENIHPSSLQKLTVIDVEVDSGRELQPARLTQIAWKLATMFHGLQWLRLPYIRVEKELLNVRTSALSFLCSCLIMHLDSNG
jgi:hypothetical protein